MKAFRTMVAAGVVMGCALHARAELANAIQALVHDSVITYQDVQTLNEQTAGLLQRQYGNQPEVFRQRMASVQTNNLEKLLEEQLILHEFKTAGYNLPESVIEDEVRDRIHAKFGDRATLTKTLQAEGVTFEQFKERIRDQFIIEAMRHKNVSSEIIVSPHKVEVYYLAHREEFKLEDEVKLRMIVVNQSTDTNAPQARKLAEEILAKVKEGASFAEMAAVYSQGSQRHQGGDWGWVEKSVLRKELAEVAFSMKPGERSGVIETPEACYLMLVEDTRKAHYKSLSEVRDQIERDLVLEERRRLEQQWVERMKKKTFVRYF